MKRYEPMRWIATCWCGPTKAEAESKKQQALDMDNIVLLVHEVLTYTPNDTQYGRPTKTHR